MKRIVIALGGNAILTDDPSAQAQQNALAETVKQLAPLIQREDIQAVITHGNGPQVGNLLLQQLEADSKKNPAMPLDTVGAMTQGEIGYWMADAINNTLGQDVDVATVVTRTVVDQNDAAFQTPTKPIGPFYAEAEMKTMQAAYPNWQFVEDAGRGYRRVVPSPKPIGMLEANAIQTLVNAGMTLVASGGGGVPVAVENNTVTGVEAVIDKDFSAAKMAELVSADELLILTAVDHVFVNFGQSDQKQLEHISVEELQQYLAENQFAAGSMKPKVEAAISFIENGGQRAVITSLDNVTNYLKNDSGTIITK